MKKLLMTALALTGISCAAVNQETKPPVATARVQGASDELVKQCLQGQLAGDPCDTAWKPTMERIVNNLRECNLTGEIYHKVYHPVTASTPGGLKAIDLDRRRLYALRADYSTKNYKAEDLYREGAVAAEECRANLILQNCGASPKYDRVGAIVGCDI